MAGAEARGTADAGRLEIEAAVVPCPEWIEVPWIEVPG
jgi:hypothetical protein